MSNRPTSRVVNASETRPVKLRIMDKEVQLACKVGEEDELAKAAAYIDQSMKELRGRNSTSSIEKIAIVAAINTAAELMKSRSAKSGEHPELTERLSAMNAKLEDLLEEEP
jgi:cell division protein ZapA